MADMCVKEEILKFIINEACDDAFQQRALKVKAQNDSHPKVELKMMCLDTSGELFSGIKKYVSGLPYESQDEHDKAFYACADLIVTCASKKCPDFTFGNAQKIINMSIKYLFIATYFDANVRNNFRYCHCPMDSIMLRKVEENYKKILTRKIGLERRGHRKDTPLVSFVNWSNIKKEKGVPTTGDTYEQIVDDSFFWYTRYQGMVKELSTEAGIFPIEYDYAVFL